MKSSTLIRRNTLNKVDRSKVGPEPSDTQWHVARGMVAFKQIVTDCFICLIRRVHKFV
jgi:hypothetical protein